MEETLDYAHTHTHPEHADEPVKKWAKSSLSEL